jgi:hypothetical protein
MRGVKAAKAAETKQPAPSPDADPTGAPRRRARSARPSGTDALIERVREELGADWPARIYREQVHTLRTRSHALPRVTGNAPVEVLHTLLGVELKVGRRRISCPDLATARYLRVFARAGVEAVAVPYDITKISRLADMLESAWQRMLLLAGHLAEMRGERASARARSAVIKEFRREVEEIGAGAAIPQFNQNTRQRPERIQNSDRNEG